MGPSNGAAGGTSGVAGPRTKLPRPVSAPGAFGDDDEGRRAALEHTAHLGLTYQVLHFELYTLFYSPGPAPGAFGNDDEGRRAALEHTSFELGVLSNPNWTGNCHNHTGSFLFCVLGLQSPSMHCKHPLHLLAGPSTSGRAGGSLAGAGRPTSKLDAMMQQEKEAKQRELEAKVSFANTCFKHLREVGCSLQGKEGAASPRSQAKQRELSVGLEEGRGCITPLSGKAEGAECWAEGRKGLHHPALRQNRGSWVIAGR